MSSTFKEGDFVELCFNELSLFARFTCMRMPSAMLMRVSDACLLLLACKVLRGQKQKSALKSPHISFKFALRLTTPFGLQVTFFEVGIYSPAMDDFWKQEEQQGESWYLDSRGRGHLSSEVCADGAKRAKKKGELNEAPVAPCCLRL